MHRLLHGAPANALHPAPTLIRLPLAAPPCRHHHQCHHSNPQYLGTCLPHAQQRNRITHESQLKGMFKTKIISRTIPNLYNPFQFVIVTLVTKFLLLLLLLFRSTNCPVRATGYCYYYCYCNYKSQSTTHTTNKLSRSTSWERKFCLVMLADKC